MSDKKNQQPGPITPEVPIEKHDHSELLHQWHTTLEVLREIEHQNPNWEWSPLQLHLERLHALAQEMRRKKTLERARWQP